jgi:diphosphomevalonate decarboxylase
MEKEQTMNEVSWQSPSNIAFIKYWGKYDNQIPANPSFSMTLNKAVTETSIRFKTTKNVSAPEMTFLFEGKENKTFESRIQKYLFQLQEHFHFLQKTNLHIRSKNSFPHSAGIASSASSMSAFALCLCSIEAFLSGKASHGNDFFSRASQIARLGSGSACRSVFGGYVTWGTHQNYQRLSNEFASPVSHNDIHPVFRNMRDSILVVRSSKKEVSSSSGHQLMQLNPYAATRFENANKNFEELFRSMKTGDFQQFAEILEYEALSLHAMMMTSKPGYILLEPVSLKIIEQIRDIRSNEGLPVTFTIDAGPNIHIIYPENEKERIQSFIRNSLIRFCEKETWIDDTIGNGPKKLR